MGQGGLCLSSWWSVSCSRQSAWYACPQTKTATTERSPDWTELLRKKGFFLKRFLHILHSIFRKSLETPYCDDEVDLILSGFWNIVSLPSENSTRIRTTIHGDNISSFFKGTYIKVLFYDTPEYRSHCINYSFCAHTSVWEGWEVISAQKGSLRIICRGTLPIRWRCVRVVSRTPSGIMAATGMKRMSQ